VTSTNGGTKGEQTDFIKSDEIFGDTSHQLLKGKNFFSWVYYQQKAYSLDRSPCRQTTFSYFFQTEQLTVYLFSFYYKNCKK
jgi:hypothetical protein